MISVVGTTREANRIAQLLAKLVIIVVERTTLRMYANLRGSDKDKSCRAKGKCTHRCDIHEIDCCDDSPKNSTESTDMDDLADQVQSLFYH